MGLDEIAREGARRMRAVALEQEAARASPACLLVTLILSRCESAARPPSAPSAAPAARS